MNDDVIARLEFAVQFIRIACQNQNLSDKTRSAALESAREIELLIAAIEQTATAAQTSELFGSK